MRKIQQDAAKILSQDQVTVRELARFVGKAVATVRALPMAPLHYRALQFQMNAVLPAQDQDTGILIMNKYNTKVHLDEESRADLRWWKLLDRRLIESPILLPKPSVLIESDASTKGWGAVRNTQTQTGGVWSVQEASNQLFRTTGSIPSTQGIQQDLESHDSPAPDGQLHNSDLCKPERRHLLSELVLTSHFHMGVVPRQEHHVGS